MGALGLHPKVLEAKGRSCASKRGWSTEARARAAAQDSMNWPGKTDAPARLWVYPCVICRRWHMTSSPGRGVAVTPTELYEGTGR